MEIHKRTGWAAVDHVYDMMAKFMVYVGAVALIICMIIAFVDVIAAKLFGSSIKYSVELITYLDVPIAYLGMGFTWLHGEMTCVDIVYGKFPRAIRKISTMAFDLLGCAACIFMTKLSFDNMIDYYVRGVLSGVKDGFPIWPFCLLESIGWIFLSIAFFFTFMRLLLKLEPIPGDEKRDPLIGDKPCLEVPMIVPDIYEDNEGKRPDGDTKGGTQK